MKDKICIFAGTTEGRTLAQILAERCDITACVATEYGEAVLEPIKGIRVHTGRMEPSEMTDFFHTNGFGRIIDATHPYADKVTQNIAAAAKEANIPVIRVLREADRRVADAVYVDSVKEARDYLSDRDGAVLITTGAKELSDYVGLDMARVWVRVLPIPSSLEACEKAGVAAAHIIAAQGPFSYESNLALLKDTGAKYIVTKSSGKNGGFEEKIRAAIDAGAVPVIIGQPPQVSGVTIDEAIALLDHTGTHVRKIDLIGIGAGDRGLMTDQAKAALKECDAVFGASAVIERLHTDKPCYAEYQPDKVRQILDEHPAIRRAAVVMRGDTGFFSGAKKMIQAFEHEDVSIIPGLSSVSVFAAKLAVSYDDAACISLHGRSANVVRTVAENRKTFILCGGKNSAGALCRRLCDYGFGTLCAAVGERLSYPDERITRDSVEQLARLSFDHLSVLYIENPSAEKRTAVGIPDDSFVRGKVPMTKSEVRAVTIAKLHLNHNAIIWDVGAGTGSVSVECALAAGEGRVFAVERNPEAVSLIRGNRIKFCTDNIEVIESEAPDALIGLPAPTHVFIGGSGGRMQEIIAAALQKNPDVRIVVNTVTLESQNEAFACAERFGFTCFEAVSVNISRSHTVGRCHMMNALNPVMIFTMQGAKRDD
jgi:precorrin-6Y C5,15-methyltransferase (decarboxylating)